MRNALVLLLVVILSNVIFSQSDTISFKLPALKITQLESGNNVIYDFENSPNWFFVNDSFLIADPQKYKYRVNINDINRVTIKTGSNILPVMVLFFGLGGLLGVGAAGGITGHSVSTGQRIIGALVGGGVLALLAGGIALLVSHDNDYMLSKNSFSVKRKNLIEILRKNRKK
jgi:hypothetical protein